jgi:hypothetical protein
MIPRFFKWLLGESWKTTLSSALFALATLAVALAPQLKWLPPWVPIAAGLVVSGRLAKDHDK